MKNHNVFDVFRRWSWKTHFLTCSFLMCLFTFWFNICDILMGILHFRSLFFGGCPNALQGGLTCNFLMCLLHFSSVIKHILMCLLHFWHLQASFWEPIGLSWGLLFEMQVGLWSFLGILWVHNGARNIEMRVSKAILAQVEVPRVSQRHSMGRFLGDVPHLLCVVLFVDVFL